MRPENSVAAPSVDESEWDGSFRVLTLDAIVRMTLTSFTSEDRMLLYDLIDVGLVEPSWLNQLAPELAARLKQLLDNPEG